MIFTALGLNHLCGRFSHDDLEQFSRSVELTVGGRGRRESCEEDAVNEELDRLDDAGATGTTVGVLTGTKDGGRGWLWFDRKRVNA